MFVTASPYVGSLYYYINNEANHKNSAMATCTYIKEHASSAFKTEACISSEALVPAKVYDMTWIKRPP
jgi:hypothetical protein